MEFLTVAETARLLRVSPITIRRYIASGQLTAERVGRGIRVRREAVERFVAPVAPNTEASDARLREESFSLLDDLGGIVGIGRSEGPDDVASNKDKYVAEAIYADKG